jgi:chromosome segregation ATPase
MDEIDAALDFKNVSIVGRFIKERTKNVKKFLCFENSQFTKVFF